MMPIIPNDDSMWMADGLCRQPGAGDLWFPDMGAGMTTTVRKAKETCGVCPVRERCLDWALAYDEQFGIWGGVNMTQTKLRHRQAMRRERQVALLAQRQRADTLLHCAGDKRRNRAKGDDE